MQSRYRFIRSLNLDQDVSSRLSDQLIRLTNGNKDVYRTPLAKSLGEKELFELFCNKFSSKLDKLHPVLSELERSNLSKFGPRSIAKNWVDRRDSVYDYFKSHSGSIDYSDLGIGVAKYDTSLRPLELSQASVLLKNNTNSGLPFLKRKGILKERVLANFESLLSRKDPCVLFTRTQEGNKTRNVWGFPMVDTLNEMRYYKPLLDYQRRTSWRSALIGPEQVNNRITEIVNSSILSGKSLISIDFSTFDATVKPGLQRASFNYVKSLYQKKFHKDIDYISDRFATIGLVTPDGVISGEHGVPSGSTFTNEVDSISQYLIAIKSGVLEDNLFEIQGDDGVYAVKPENVDTLINSFRHYGLNVNIDKSYVSKDYVVYLQNLYHNELRNNGRICGIYPIARAFNRLIFQESWDDFEDYGLTGKDYYSIRSISILENCKYHPLFEDFVTFILSLDKYKLQVSQEGITRYVEMMSSKSGTEGLFTNQYGDDVRGIKRFITFKTISKLIS